jgi:hypothetical protein
MFRDTVVTAAMKKREALIFALCFLAAYVLNVIGIIAYGSPARELVTQLHVVLLVALVLYGAVVLLRLLYYLLSRFWTRK